MTPSNEDGTIPGCADLYIIPADGTGATRLSATLDGRYISGGAFSPDDTHVAFVRWSPEEAAVGATVTVIDLMHGSVLEQSIETGTAGNDLSPSTLAWSSSGTWIAAEHDGLLSIVDPTGATPSITYPRGDYTTAFRWSDDGTLLVVRDPGLLALRGLHVDSFDVDSRTATVVGRVDATNIEDAFRSFRLSPDGRRLFFQGGVLTAVPAEDVKYVGYLVPVTGGVPVQILTAEEASSLLGWSADSHALVFLAEDQTVIRLEVDSFRRSAIGTIPADDTGVWRIP